MKLRNLLFLGALAFIASAPSPAGGLAPKCGISDDQAYQIYQTASEFANVECYAQDGHSCTMDQWSAWYDYMWNAQVNSISDGKCGHPQN